MATNYYVGFSRVLELPAEPKVDRLYFVRPPGADKAQMYLVGTDGVPTQVGGGGGTRAVHIKFDGTVPEYTFPIVGYALAAQVVQLIAGLKTTAGTCNVTVAIDGVPVTGLTAVQATTTPAGATATGANSVAVGQAVTVAVTDIAGATGLELTIGIE